MPLTKRKDASSTLENFQGTQRKNLLQRHVTQLEGGGIEEDEPPCKKQTNTLLNCPPSVPMYTEAFWVATQPPSFIGIMLEHMILQPLQGSLSNHPLQDIDGENQTVQTKQLIHYILSHNISKDEIS